jgi:aryl-phospho-beta-D-glucosidase BglC (GH1 family)
MILCAAIYGASSLLTVCDSCNSDELGNGWIGSNDTLNVDENGYLRNRLGKEVVLRGVNLGGWMIQESWMCPVYGPDRQWANLDTINALKDREFTAAQIQELFDTYQDNWITADDFDFFKSKGVNSIRVPFWYRNFMSDEAGTWINNDNGSSAVTANPGFKRLDWVITQAKKRGIYVILDMHGAPGGQSMDHCSGTLGKNELYTNQAYEQITADLWKAIASRYKDEAAVAAYDLLNEPQNNGGYSGLNAWAPGSTRAIYETVRMYDILYRAVRSADPNKICIMEGIWSMNLPDPKYVHNGRLNQNSRFSGKTTVWVNVMYSMHLYDSKLNDINSRVNELKKARNDWKVAVHVGEFNNGDNQQTNAYKLYNDNKISWNMWTYKIAGANMGNWSLYQAARKVKADPMTDSFETIKQKWGETLSTFFSGTNDINNGYSVMKGIEQYFSPGMEHTINDVFTNSNQAGFPTGGISGPISTAQSTTSP